MPTSSRAKFYGGLLVVFLGALTIGLAALSREPDIDLSFVRDVPSDQGFETLGKAIQYTVNWPSWFYSLASAEVVNQVGIPYSGRDQVVMNGSLIRLNIDPRKGKWRKFSILTRVTGYVPNRMIELQVLSDTSAHPLMQAFERITWKVELLPRADGQPGALVRGTALARTASWRTRLFGRIAERIVMNQVYYPNVMALGGLTQPSAQYPFLPSQQ